MGSSLKHLKDGEDFGPEHFSTDFGFHGSAESPHVSKPTREKGHKGPHHTSHEGAPKGDLYAHGGRVEHHADGGHTIHHKDGRREMHHAHGGHSVYHVGGTIEHHYADGGFSIHHPSGHVMHKHADGTVEHHHANGTVQTIKPDGSMESHDGASEYAHGGSTTRQRFADGGDVAQDKKMVKKAVRQHEDHEHGGEHTELHLARGGPVRRPRMRKPHGAAGMAMNRAPANPAGTVSPRDEMPGGQEPYGVEPSAEPDDAGSEQGITQMRRGGRVHR